MKRRRTAPTDGREKQTPTPAEETRGPPLAATTAGTSPPASQPFREGFPKPASLPIPPGRRRRFFRLTYTNNPPREEPKLFKCRDGIAFDEINATLTASDYAYEMAINLYPDDTRGLDQG